MYTNKYCKTLIKGVLTSMESFTLVNAFIVLYHTNNLMYFHLEIFHYTIHTDLPIAYLGTFQHKICILTLCQSLIYMYCNLGIFILLIKEY